MYTDSFTIYNEMYRNQSLLVQQRQEDLDMPLARAVKIQAAVRLICSESALYFFSSSYNTAEYSLKKIDKIARILKQQDYLIHHDFTLDLVRPVVQQLTHQGYQVEKRFFHQEAFSTNRYIYGLDLAGNLEAIFVFIKQRETTF